MKIWKLLIATVFAIVIGFGIGYYAFDVSYENIEKTQHENLQLQLQSADAPTPSPSVTPSSATEKEANALGEAYSTPDKPAGKEEGYMLKEYIGRIAVYKTYTSGQTTLVNIIDVLTEALPESDRRLLSDGIDGLSYEEMLQLLEDYTS